MLQIMFLSKMTAAVLDDLNYIVDPSAVSSYADYAVVHCRVTIHPTRPFERLIQRNCGSTGCHGRH